MGGPIRRLVTAIGRSASEWAEMPTPVRHPAGARRAIAALLAIALVLAACLPATNPPSAGPTAGPSGSGSPAPSGPTPTPSFVRPTPTPLPSFLAVVVAAGDTLNSIARTHATTARSIAWWNRATYPSLNPESADYRPELIQPGWVLVLIPGITVDDANPPTLPPGTPGPTITLPPIGSPLPAVTPTPGEPAIVLNHGPRGTNRIALTFDMGGRLDPALDIMAWLSAEEIHATIFPTGSTADGTTVGRDVIRLAADQPELFDLANHSWDHPDFTGLEAAAIADQLDRTEAVIAEVGATTKPWFRPPYGAWDEGVARAVADAGWAYLVMWDIDTIDWRPTADGGPTASDIVTKVVSRAQGGSIVLMHLGGFHTLEALPELVAGLRAKGLVPVTLSELLGS